MGSLKLNTYGTIFPSHDHGSIGCFLCDESGHACMVASKPEANLTDALEVELLAILISLQQCLPLGHHCLIIERDILLGIQALEERIEAYADYNNLLW